MKIFFKSETNFIYVYFDIKLYILLFTYILIIFHIINFIMNFNIMKLNFKDYFL